MGSPAFRLGSMRNLRLSFQAEVVTEKGDFPSRPGTSEDTLRGP